jgi:hypothetical protein
LTKRGPPSAIVWMQRALAIVLCLLAAGCSSSRRIDELAREAGLERVVVDAAGYASVTYLKHGAAPLAVFLEGDGAPWRGGVEPSEDPTTRHPVALELLLRTPGAGAYVGRPCYHRLEDPRCTPDHWTHARYSEAVVNSMIAAVREAAQLAGVRQIELVGYSGGGALAVLVAERLEGVVSVTTIGANLDVEAWTRHHRYLPLERSLDPARSDRAHPWRELHLQGARDVNVPPATTDAYFARYPGAQRRVIAEFDHVCCWVDAWPELLGQKNGE